MKGLKVEQKGGRKLGKRRMEKNRPCHRVIYQDGQDGLQKTQYITRIYCLIKFEIIKNHCRLKLQMSCSLHRHSNATQGHLLPPSQRNLGLPRTHLSLTFAVNTKLSSYIGLIHSFNVFKPSPQCVIFIAIFLK